MEVSPHLAPATIFPGTASKFNGDVKYVLSLNEFI